MNEGGIAFAQSGEDFPTHTGKLRYFAITIRQDVADLLHEAADFRPGPAEQVGV